MPSYRVIIPVGRVAIGVDPATILPAVVERVAESATVEASDVGVVRSVARITVRFGADDDAVAGRVALTAVDRMRELARVDGVVRVTRRDGGIWSTVAIG